jgi:hypothetical protein
MSLVELFRSYDLTHMSGQETVDDSFAVTIRNSSFVILPFQSGITRIRPNQIVQQTVVGHV